MNHREDHSPQQDKQQKQHETIQLQQVRPVVNHTNNWEDQHLRGPQLYPHPPQNPQLQAQQVQLQQQGKGQGQDEQLHAKFPSSVKPQGVSLYTHDPQLNDSSEQIGAPQFPAFYDATQTVSRTVIALQSVEDPQGSLQQTDKNGQASGSPQVPAY